jgi:hypothetical protein
MEQGKTVSIEMFTDGISDVRHKPEVIHVMKLKNK